jgi:hypothetical protein
VLKAKGKEKKNRRFAQNHLVNSHIFIYAYRGKLHKFSLVDFYSESGEMPQKK